MATTIPTNDQIHDTFAYTVIYVYSIQDESHKGRLKIGKATVNSLSPTQSEINAAADRRIKQQATTVDVSPNLEHAELAVTFNNLSFSDTDVHNILIRSGYERKAENIKNARSEWFEIPLEIAKNAIQAAKEGRKALSTIERIPTSLEPIQFRPNQLEAIALTTKAISQKKKKFLWNAKMRFGKTSTALEVARKNKMQKVLIVTHRPSVNTDWKDDFDRVFLNSAYQFSSRTQGEDIHALVREQKPFVYFASMQDLRGSKRVVSDDSSKSHFHGHDKNDEIFDTNWDMLIVDEAHEGTQSDLGDATFKQIARNFTLQLSGTPFNILHKHEEDEIYTWDYINEQEAKLSWDDVHSGVPNPYADLPELKIFTYDIDKYTSKLGQIGPGFHDALDGAFRFHEFFRVQKNDQGEDLAQFVHEPMVKKFLDLLVDYAADTQFPYSTKEYRGYIKHSLWLLPNRVKVIEAMQKLLENHPVFGFGHFGIVNISGDAREEDEDKLAKERVRGAIKNYEYTITLTGQRLTTGASIPEWTAVFMMSDTTSATTYLQTAFRCQTPANIDGKLKTHGFVFDFAPDRTLKLIAEAVELNHKASKTNSPEQVQLMEKFLNFCPILAAEGGLMKPYDVKEMLVQLKKAVIERVSRNGFDDPKLYNDELLKLNELDISKFNQLKKIVGSSTAKKVNEIEVNNLGMNDLVVEVAEIAERKKKDLLSEEEKQALRKLKEAREQKKTAISILRAVSIRMPMLVYGADVAVHADIDLDTFIQLVDDESWREFMPEGLTKEAFQDFTKYYDKDVFRGVTRSIRAKVADCDDLPPTERVQAIADIFKTFKNPDKETVLTPWDVVNRQITLTLGGHDFRVLLGASKKPEWVSQGVDAGIWAQDNVKILEINSKSGLYPLLATYNIYTRLLKKEKQSEDVVFKRLWKKVLEDNIYVLCKSPMARTITQRTLAGYDKHARLHVVHIHDLVKKLQKKEKYQKYDFRDELAEKFGLSKDGMKFTAVVGNPPYQVNTGTNFATPVYHLFFEAAKSLNPEYISLIHPARFLFNAGATPKEWNTQMLNDPHLSVPLYEPNSQKVFAGVDIKGGVCITFWNCNKAAGGLGGRFIAFKELVGILEKTKSESLVKIIYPQTKTVEPLDKLFPTELRIRPNYFEKFPETFRISKNNQFNATIVGLEKGNIRTQRYASETVLSDPLLNLWKVFLPESNGSGAIGEVLSTPLVGEPLVGEPLVGCTGSFIQFGSFYTQDEAINCVKYIKTKFSRALLGTLKVTQDNPKNKWKNVPLQDFTDKSDIDWSQSVAEIDKQLYRKYKLDDNEINFIETHVKAME